MPIIQISEFTKKTMQQIQRIPMGRVATYKQIAELAGKPQGSRGVAWILHSCSTVYKLPWHRVLSSQGKISFDPKSSQFRRQMKLLQNEGVIISKEGKLSLAKFQWKKRPPQKKNKSNQPNMFK